MKLANLAAYSFYLVATLLLARFELHTDDAGVVAFFIVAITFVLGCLHPRHAWQWALLVGPAVPVADALFPAKPHVLHALGDLALLAAFVVVLGLAGSYAGVLARRVFSSLGGAAV